jgi:hypothetical protein
MVFGLFGAAIVKFGLTQIGRFGTVLRQKNGEKRVFFCIFL